MASRKLSLYFNILVFSVIAGIVSLFLLLLLVFGSGAVSQYTALIVTVQVGLIVVIIAAMYKIYKFEKSLKNAKYNSMVSTMTIRSCPDYWTAKESRGNARMCHRAYTIPQDSDDDSKSGSVIMQGSRDTIDLSEFNGRTMKDVCANVGELDTPWTDVRAACGGFSMSTQNNEREA